MSLLNSHPQILCEGEILVRLEGRRGIDIVRRAFLPQPGFIKAKGFKLFYYHPVDIVDQELWSFLSADIGLKVLHLRRRNQLQVELSKCIAEQTGVWISKTKSNKNLARLRVEPALLEARFAETEEQEKKCRELFMRHDFCDLLYEDLVADVEDQFSTVCNFLGVKSVSPITLLKKQQTSSVEEIVSNLDELKDYFGNSKHSAYFRDGSKK